MPCNALPVAYKRGGRQRIVTPEGDVISADTNVTMETAEGLGYIPHWGTCPAADQFKGRKTK